MTISNRNTQALYLFIISFIFVSIAGCATSKSNTSKQLYEAEEIKKISKYVEINATSSNNNWNIAPKLKNSMKKELKKRNYTLTGEKKDSITVNVHIEHFDDGSQAARLTIGQFFIPSAGHASLDYNLEIVDESKDKILVKSMEKIRYCNFDPNLASLDEYSVTDCLGGSEAVTDRMVKMATEKILKDAKCWD